MSALLCGGGLGLITLIGLIGLSAVPAPSAARTPIVFTGMCDASAGVGLDATRMIVANDEDNWLRVYDAAQGGAPLQQFDISRFVHADPKEPETDLEGACRLRDHIFWITSHGRSRKGKFRRSRHNLFATRWTDRRFETVGQPYQRLLLDLVSDPRLAKFHLDQASRRAPKEPGALNIEALCATPEGHLLIGFRNPIPGGRALIVPLLNPFEVIQGRRARLGGPILIDLGGFGIRDMARWQGEYLILAGRFGVGPGTGLYRWAGPRSGQPPRPIPALTFPDLNPEAIVVFEPAQETPRVMLLSDDGTRRIHRRPCKKLKDPAQRRFRAVWVHWPQEGAD